MTNKKPSVKRVLHGIELPLHQNLIYWTSPSVALEQSLRLLRLFYWYENEVAQSCLTLYNPMDCSLLGSSVHGIFQARILEWVAISFSRGSSPPRDWTQVSCIVGRRVTLWATREVLVIWSFCKYDPPWGAFHDHLVLHCWEGSVPVLKKVFADTPLNVLLLD